MNSHEVPTIPGYEVLDLLGAGGAGEVWVVRRPDGVRLAAKLVQPTIGAHFGEQDLLQRLDHEHVVRLRQVLTEDGGTGRQVLILDLAEGGSLADAIAARATLTAGELVTVLTPIARTLHDLHGTGLVHADISTGNILFTDAGKPLLADLGVSRLAGSYDEHTWATEAWAAPEVLAGGVAGPASDVWSLGAVAWACVTGAPPPPMVERPELAGIAPHMSDAVIGLIDDAMGFEPELRPSAGEFALRLWRCAAAEPAPVAGSPGARRRAVALEPELLTRRMIRTAREADAGGDPAPGPQGVLARLRAALPDRRATIPVAAAVLATSALTVGVWTALPTGPSYAVGAVSSAPLASTSHVAPTASGATSGVTRSQPATTNGSASAPAPVQTPSQIVTALVAARARAWNQEDPRLLGYALAPNSPADKADRAALTAARKQGVDYQGLVFEPGQLSVTDQEAGRMTVVVPIRRADYVVTAGTSMHSKAAISRRVTLHLVKVGPHWRIHSWT